MKRISLISGAIIVIAVITMALTLNTAPGPGNTTLNVKVSGCGDCSHLQYCLEDGTSGNPGSCEFTIVVPNGTHFLCIKCHPPEMDLGGGKTIECTGGTIDVKMDIPLLKNCECDSKKKK